MTQIPAKDIKAPSHVSVVSTSTTGRDTENPLQESPKTPCVTHGPSQVPLLDRELQKQYATEFINTIISALDDINDDTKCIRCSVANASALLTAQFRDLQAAKRNGEWSRDERKALKAEVKATFKPVKKDIKKLWKESRH